MSDAHDRGVGGGLIWELRNLITVEKLDCSKVGLKPITSPRPVITYCYLLFLFYNIIVDSAVQFFANSMAIVASTLNHCVNFTL